MDVQKERGLRAYPASHWDAQAWAWAAIVSDRRNPHQFYYYEADRCIAELLTPRMRVLELGCGTGGSTKVHAAEVAQVVAFDFSREMVRGAAHATRRLRGRGRIDLLVADAAHLPFRAGVFHAVVSRGVVLSYVASPRAVLDETHRVLRRGGKLGLDVMNYQRDWSEPVRAFSKVGRSHVYTETRVVGGRQVRRVWHLSEACPYFRRRRRPVGGQTRPIWLRNQCENRPRWLRKYTVFSETHEAWLFRPEQVARMVSGSGFRETEVTPLGILPRALSAKDRGFRRFLLKNRKSLSDLSLFLAEHWRPESALHLFVSATRA